MNEYLELKHLISQQELQQADAIVLLAGDRFHRVSKVAELYHAGLAPFVVVTSSADDWDYGSLPSRKLVPELVKLGIKEVNIIAEETAAHTRAEADSTLRMAKEKGWTSLILVTTPYHQYRALLTWIKALNDNDVNIELFMGTTQTFPEFKEESEDETLQREMERIKLYQDKGDVASWKEGEDYLKKRNMR